MSAAMGSGGGRWLMGWGALGMRDGALAGFITGHTVIQSHTFQEVIQKTHISHTFLVI